MKTTSEQLLARAEELEARARALRVSAVEMNGHQTAEKQGKVKELFQAATKIRKAVKVWEEPEPEPELPPLPRRQRYKARELAPYLERLLDGATRTTVELASLLKDQGAVNMNAHRLRSMLPQFPQITRASGVQGTDIRWQLKSQSKRKYPAGYSVGRNTGKKWTPAQHKKFVATMKRVNAEKRAATAAEAS